MKKKYALYHDGDPYDGLDETGNAEGLAPLEILRPDEMLHQLDEVNISAPMVRYSKLAARMLWSRYNTHITYTPMILAKEFALSQKARDSDFTTNGRERGLFSIDNGRRRIRGGLVAQFAAKRGQDFADAVELLAPYVDGVDLNCGCPQPWAYQEEIGSYLLRQPHIVQDIVKQARQRVSSNYCVSIKIRIDPEQKLTSQLVQTAIHAGASYIAVHGRTRRQRDTEPVNLDGIKFAREEAKGQVPVVGNGDVFTLEDSVRMKEYTGVKAAMAARGILENPALFAEHEKTPYEAIDRFLDISTSTGLIFPLFHRHVSYMLEKHFVSRPERIYFNSLVSHAGVIDWVEEFLAKRRAGDFSPVTGLEKYKAFQPSDLEAIFSGATYGTGGPGEVPVETGQV